MSSRYSNETEQIREQIRELTLMDVRNFIGGMGINNNISIRTILVASEIKRHRTMVGIGEEFRNMLRIHIVMDHDYLD